MDNSMGNPWFRRLLPEKLIAWIRWRKAVPALSFEGSEQYWRERYAVGGNSGGGSYGALANFKARVLNEFVRRHGVESVIEFGCGDGNQLTLSRYPLYIGVDVSPDAVQRCRLLFEKDPTKVFLTVSDYAGEQCQLSLSLDVIYHLVEDDVFEQYMQRLFDAGSSYVGVYSTNFVSDDGVTARHVRHRRFSDWVEVNRSEWSLCEHVKNTEAGSGCDFFFYTKRLN
ncbi:MAG: class I SAM-dependent methyltransferase [Planctomyces sp.]|jgi:hypothetical protein